MLAYAEGFTEGQLVSPRVRAAGTATAACSVMGSLGNQQEHAHFIILERNENAKKIPNKLNKKYREARRSQGKKKCRRDYCAEIVRNKNTNKITRRSVSLPLSATAMLIRLRCLNVNSELNSER